jgi:hypothetical protein
MTFLHTHTRSLKLSKNTQESVGCYKGIFGIFKIFLLLSCMVRDNFLFLFGYIYIYIYSHTTKSTVKRSKYY